MPYRVILLGVCCALTCDSSVLASTGVALAAGGMPLTGQVDSTPEPARPEIMSQEKYERLRALLPDVADARIQKVLQDGRLILYTDAEMPKAYQDWDGGLQGVHSPEYNISANASEPHGNANIEFPWGTPAGTHRADNVSSFRFLWLPTAPAARRCRWSGIAGGIRAMREPGTNGSFPWEAWWAKYSANGGLTGMATPSSCA